VHNTTGRFKEGPGRAAVPHSKYAPLCPTPNALSDGCIVQCLCSSVVTSVRLAFSSADIEFGFVLMTSAYSQYLRDSCKQHLALVVSYIIFSSSVVSSV